MIPTRGLLGFRSRFLTLTRGTGVLSTLFEGYRPGRETSARASRDRCSPPRPAPRTRSALPTPKSAANCSSAPGVEVYEGMIVGKHQREGDLEVNVCKMKQLTNMRSSNSDIAVRLTRPIEMSLDRASSTSARTNWWR